MSAIKHIQWQRMMPFIALIIIVVFSAIISDTFLVERNITNVLRQVSYTGIIAIGMTFVIVAAGIDLSVGSMAALVGIISMMSLNKLHGFDGAPMGEGSAIFVYSILCLVIGLILGAINGVLITVGRIAAFIATLGTMSVFRSLAVFFSDAKTITNDSDLLYDIGGGYILGLPVPVIIFFILVLIGHFLLNSTSFGRHICAVGSNEEVARFSAISVNKTRFFTYVIAGFCVGVSALMLDSRICSVSGGEAGHFYELDAIAAVVIGGTALSGGRGTVIGSAIGALILGIIDNMLNLMNVSSYLQGSVKGCVILIAVLAQFKRK
jgi:ribose transport system permease protein